MHGGRAKRPSSVAAGPSKLQSLGGSKGLELVANGDAADRLLKTRQDDLFTLSAIEVQQKRFHRPDCGGGEGQCAISENGQCQSADRLRSELAAECHWLAVLLCLVGDVLQRA